MPCGQHQVQYWANQIIQILDLSIMPVYTGPLGRIGIYISPYIFRNCASIGNAYIHG